MPPVASGASGTRNDLLAVLSASSWVGYVLGTIGCFTEGFTRRIIMDYRKIFDDNVSPEDFDKWRTRYCDELFADVIEHSNLGKGKKALEIGPGTGQATEPILKTGCSYLAIELGENFTKDMKSKFGSYEWTFLVL